MEQPLISIIIPVYKVEKYLDRCLESVVNQTYRNLEIILVDDGSPDSCPTMCDEWAKKDPRIKVIHKENNGVSSARNVALDIVNGDYIGFVDSDDYIETIMYDELMKAAIKFNADVTLCDFTVNDINDEMNKKSENIPVIEALKQVVSGDYKYGVLWNKLFKSTVIKNIRMPDLICSEDMVFNYYALNNSERIVSLSAKLYHYSQNDESTVHKGFGKGAFQAISAREIILNDCNDKVIKEYALYGYIVSCYFVLNDSVKNNMFFDKFNELRALILSNKEQIYESKLFSLRIKLKTFLLSVSPVIYKRVLLTIYRKSMSHADN